MLVATFLFFGIIILLSLFGYFRRSNRLIRKIPGPFSWPIVGNSLTYTLPHDKLFLYLRSLYKTYGGINQGHAINVRVVNLYSPDDIEGSITIDFWIRHDIQKSVAYNSYDPIYNLFKTIMSTTRYNNKERPYSFLKPWLGEGLLISNGEKWHQRRKLLTKTFHFEILKRYMQTFIEQTEGFLDQIAKEEGKPVDIFPVVSQTSLRIICCTSMGTVVSEDSWTKINKYFDALKAIGAITVKRICRAWFYFDLIFNLSPLYKVQKGLVSTLHEFTTSIVKARKEEFMNSNKEHIDNNNIDTTNRNVYGAKGRLAMLDLLLQNEKEGLIDLDGIREEVDTFMFEGHDTIAMATSFFIMRIANEPIIQNKIYEEMREIFGDLERPPTMEDLSKMKFLEYCIKESLRLYPSVPFLARYLVEDVVLSGYKVPAYTICQIHVFDMHRCEKLYPEPDKFLPERFTKENSVQRHPYAYIPFSAGPRNCIGQKFAMLEMKTVLSSLLRKFRLDPVTTPKEIAYRGDLVLRPLNPVYVRFFARK